MFPISSLTSPAAASAVGNNAGVNPAGTATDAPATASAEVDLSPVAGFLLSVTNAQEQLSNTQRTGAQRAETVNAAVQEVVDAFNLLPSVDFDQGAARQAPLLNNLVGSLNRNDGGDSQAQRLAQLGVTLQPPLLSDLTGGLSLEPELLRAAVNANNEQTTATLQHTLNTFRQIATDFAEQLSAAGSSQIPGLNPEQQPALTQADLVANARLDLARAALENLAQNQAALNQQLQGGNFQQPQAAQQTQQAGAVPQAAAAQQAAAAEQAAAAQAAAARNAANAPTDPLRANPALAAAIAAYHINDVAGTATRAAPPAAGAAIPAVGAVSGPAPIRALGTTP